MTPKGKPVWRLLVDPEFPIEIDVRTKKTGTLESISVSVHETLDG